MDFVSSVSPAMKIWKNTPLSELRFACERTSIGPLASNVLKSGKRGMRTFNGWGWEGFNARGKNAMAIDAKKDLGLDQRFLVCDGVWNSFESRSSTSYIC